MSKMDIANLVSADNEPSNSRGSRELTRASHSYSTRHGNAYHTTSLNNGIDSTLPRSSLDRHAFGITPAPTPHMSRSPEKSASKTVHFHLMLSDHSQQRLPLRLMIKDHDTAESIISTVKSFWGLYEGQGLSFEDDQGNTLIAQYENLHHDAKVFVRVHTERPQLGEPFQMIPPQPISRPGSRTMKRRDTSSPSGRADRSGSLMAQLKTRTLDDDNNSDSDAGSVSVSSSRRARAELASAEISLDNILEGGRRKRAKFESSELPLFAPPQQPLPNSISSTSPQRRFQNGDARSPITYNNQTTFSYTHHPVAFSPPGLCFTGFATPQTGSIASGYFGTAGRSNGHQLIDAGRMGPPYHASSASGILPTPDPTIGSVISDEDVAIQLMRLGNTSNISRGRTSTSTIDDTLSGKAEAPSSSDGSEDGIMGEDERPLPNLPSLKQKHSYAAGPARKRMKGLNGVTQHYSSDGTSGDDYEDVRDGTFKGESDEIGPQALNNSLGKTKLKVPKQKSRTSSSSSKNQPGQVKNKLKSSSTKLPSLHTQIPHDPRSALNSATSGPQPLQADEEDLSTKPRCQRCRKSKKGCDRQRPCQRCKDAGIGIEGCVSEDEGNGRKGRFGRHMGVAVKKEVTSFEPNSEIPHAYHIHGHSSGPDAIDAGKKRKR